MKKHAPGRRAPVPAAALYPIERVSKRQVGMCGPQAVAAIAGRPVEHVTAWINWKMNRRERQHVGGTWWHHLSWALHELGYKPVEAWRYRGQHPAGHGLRAKGERENRPTLKQFVEHLPASCRGYSVFLVNVGHHWVAMSRTHVYDSFHPEGKHVLSCLHLRKRVRQVFGIVEDGAAWRRDRTRPNLPEGVEPGDLL